MTQVIKPTFPCAELPDSFFWPVSNRNYISSITLETLENCTELTGQQGLADGSGKSDAFIYKTGNWCLKTSLRNRFKSIDEGQEALVKLSKKKFCLDHLLPPKTILVLQPENEKYFWLWTITPWYKTLRSLMIEAVETNNEPLLAAALQAYARVSIDSLVITSQKNLSLDIHPSNFALPDYSPSNKIELINYENVVYLDDDMIETTDCLIIGYALLKRIDEYEKWSKALSIYILTLEDAILTKLTQKDVRKLRLLQAFQDIPLRTTLAQKIREDIVSIIKQCQNL
ncbi:MAG: hypothetical protein HY819_05930 [Acidobacteria bacterium]|nr:hypothetical protein [Acidobacteriota bacterium]